MVKIIKVLSVLKYFVFFLIFVIVAFFYLNEYPQYLFFLPKTYFSNKYYSVILTSSIHSLIIDHKERACYYGIFTTEENYKGKWMLEKYDNSYKYENETVLIVYTRSHLFTQNIFKQYVFFKDRNYFFVNITKEYLISDTDLNNQIILDLKAENVSFQILYSNYPTSWQIGSIREPTERQINFNNQSDTDILFHKKGLIETVIIEMMIGNDKTNTSLS